MGGSRAIFTGAGSAALLSALLVGWPGPALAGADSISDAMNPRSVALGESIRAAAMGSSAITLNPAGAALTRAYVLEGNFGVRPVDDARTAQASVCDSVTSRVAACLYYEYFTAKPEGGERVAHEVGLTTAFPIGELMILGVTNRYKDYAATVGDTEVASVSGFGMDAGLIVKLSSLLNVAVVGYNLVGDDPAQYPLGVGGGVAVFITPTVMLSGDAAWNLENDMGRFGGGLEIFVATQGGQVGYPLRGGYLYDELTGSSYATGGLGYVTPRVALDVGLRRQVSGTLDGAEPETMVQGGLRLFLPN